MDPGSCQATLVAGILPFTVSRNAKSPQLKPQTPHGRIELRLLTEGPYRTRRRGFESGTKSYDLHPVPRDTGLRKAGRGWRMPHCRWHGRHLPRRMATVTWHRERLPRPTARWTEQMAAVTSRSGHWPWQIGRWTGTMAPATWHVSHWPRPTAAVARQMSAVTGPMRAVTGHRGHLPRPMAHWTAKNAYRAGWLDTNEDRSRLSAPSRRGCFS